MSRRKNIMLCYPFEEKRLVQWLRHFPSIMLQPKLDGHRCRALIKSDGVELLSSEENSLNFAVPHIAQKIWDDKAYLTEHGIFELDGELYVHGVSFDKLSSVIKRTKDRHPDYYHIQYHIFDFVCNSTTFYERDFILSDALYQVDDPYIVKIPSMFVDSMTGIESALVNYTSLGYEGLIARNPVSPYIRKRSTNMMKWKPRKSDQYLIIDCIEELDQSLQPKGRLGAFVVTDDQGTAFKVGTGFTAEQRHQYWVTSPLLIGRNCIIKYQHTTDGGVPRFPVFDVLVE